MRKGHDDCYRITAHIRRIPKVLFSQVSVCLHQEGIPSPSHNTSIGHPISIPEYFHWSHVLSGGTPVTGPMSLPGEVPQSQVGVPQSWLGSTPGWGTPGQVRMGYPPARTGVPPDRMEYSRDSTAERALAIRWAVCLLCSHRRTALFYLFIYFQHSIEMGGWDGHQYSNFTEEVYEKPPFRKKVSLYM